MNCREIQRKFSHFFDDLLCGKKNGVLFEHLSRCDTCRKAWEQFVGIFNSLRCLPKEELPFDLVPGVMSKIEEIEQRSCWWRRLFSLEGFRPVVGVLAVTLIVFTTVIIYKNLKAPPMTARVTDISENVRVADQVQRGTVTRSAVAPGQFATGGVPLAKDSNTVVTIYVDDVEQAERKISSLASRVLLSRNYRLNSGNYPHKVLTQFRIDIPATELDFLMKELTKIGQVSHDRGYDITPGDKLHITPGNRSHVVFRVTETTTYGSAVNQYHGRKKMGQDVHAEIPMVPVSVVVISKGKK